MKTRKKMNISVIGLGKLGLPLAASIASKGFFVYGVDINKKVIDDLNKGYSSLAEPNLSKIIKKFKSNISASLNTIEAVLSSDVTFIITPTPSQKNGYFSLEYINKVVEELSMALKIKQSYHLVVIVSTIMPGSMSKITKVLERKSGKKLTRDFGLCYNPEFIALGSVIQNLLNPDFILIGESDKKSGDILEKFYKVYCENKPKIARMNFVNAELSKISVNTFITTKISYANMLAEICEKLPGGDVDVVTSTIGFDSRIGAKYLKGGPAFGGPCFPRDNIAFISLAKNLKSSYIIANSTHKTNLRQTGRLIEVIVSYLKKNSSVGILGLSYKPFTDVIEESVGLNLAQYLASKNIKLNLHDPLALKNVEKILGRRAEYIDDLKQCMEKSQILVIATDWPQFKDINTSWFGATSKILIDPWRIIDEDLLPKNVTYHPFGLNLSE